MTQRTTKAQKAEWQRRVTAMPTRADIDRCIECWPKDWQDKSAFYNGQVATLLEERERLQAELDDANERIAALAALLAAEKPSEKLADARE